MEWCFIGKQKTSFLSRRTHNLKSMMRESEQAQHVLEDEETEESTGKQREEEEGQEAHLAFLSAKNLVG